MDWNRISWNKIVLLGVLLLVVAPVAAETKLEIEEAKITGARELPKVLYIVPWKRSRPELDALPMRSLVEERLEPVDMDEFRRQVRYHALTQPATAPNP